MRKLLLLSLLLVAGGLAAVSAATGSAAKRVTVGDDYFVRPSGVPTVTVDKGTRVRWVFTGRSPHNVKVVTGPVKFGSSTMSSGTYTKRMRQRGTYTIICTVHGAANQKMKLVVE